MIGRSLRIGVVVRPPLLLELAYRVVRITDRLQTRGE